MSKLFLGVGMAFPVGLDESGAMVRAEYEESVRESIWIILGTAKGERVMRPDFGCGIHDFVFASLNSATINRVNQTVREALLNFETRIDVIDVTARPDGDGNVLFIVIDYEVRATNNAFNLVYPFYLQGGSA